MALKPSHSIRTRVALLAVGSTLVVVALIATVAYREVRRSALSVTREHLAAIAQQLGSVLSTSALQTEAQAKAVADDSAIVHFLRDRDPVSARAAAALTMALAKQTSSRAIELLDTASHRVLATNDTAILPMADAGAAAFALPPSAAVRIGEIAKIGRRLGYTVVARIGTPEHPLGFLLERRPMATPAARTQLEKLVGEGATLYVGNAENATWTDFVDAAPAPRVTVPGMAEYERAGSGVVLSNIAAIPNTPWLIAVESPRSRSLAPARELLWRLALITVLLLLVAALGSWRLSAALTRPIVTLASRAADFGVAPDIHRGDDEVGVLHTAFDTMANRVTETRSTLKQTVDELHDTEARYRTLFDASPQPVWAYDTNTLRFLAVNDAAVQRYGYTRDEFLAMTVLEIRPPEELAATRKALAGIASKGDVESALWRHRAKDGSDIEVEVASRALVFSGRPARLVLIHDLTTRRRAEESLRAAQERLERVLGSSGAILFELRLEPAGAVLEWASANATSILGYEIAEMQGERWWIDGLHLNDRLAFGDNRVAESEGDRAREYRFRHKDGRYRWLREEQRVLPGASDGQPRIVGVWLDITEQRELEVQFRQSQKMDAIGRLAGGIAHDFNNLLTVILSEAHFARHGSGLTVEERDESLIEIGKAAERAALLTRQLLSFSRRSVLDSAPLDLNIVVSDVQKMMRRLIGEDVELTLNLSAVPVVATMDQGQLEQIFVNLVVNARDAMPEGGTLTIETRVVDLDQGYASLHTDVAPGRYAVLSVSDSGTGMSDEVKAHIFEPFFTTKEKGKGTGLGLATCYGIAKQFRGHIGVYSEPGIGTTVRLYLPYLETDVAVSVSESPEARGGTETILLVEDEEPVRRTGARTLRALGYHVLEAASGERAFELLSEHVGGVDLLISDVVLPGLGGPAIAERVRESLPGVAVLFLSGYSDDVVLRHRLIGRDALLLQKPFSAQALALKVREALARHPVAISGEPTDLVVG